MSENENNFEALRHLLALKRHEVPPPGYFENFSDGVLARIHASDAVRELPWLLRVLQAFESRPAFPVAFASTLCFLLLFGIVSVEQNPEMASGQPAFIGNGSAFVSVADNSPLMPVGMPSAITGDTNHPIDLSSQPAFNSQPNSLFQQESFSPSGN
jgi:hypothetical protein